jgi:hypothetical protein
VRLLVLLLQGLRLVGAWQLPLMGRGQRLRTAELGASRAGRAVHAQRRVAAAGPSAEPTATTAAAAEKL